MKKEKVKAAAEGGISKGADSDLTCCDCNDEIVVPVCFGEFSHKDAEKIKELWEKTWSSDSRYIKPSKRSNKEE